MSDEFGNSTPPESSEVFETTDGKKVRLEYDRVYSYLGSKTKTTIEYGYSYEREDRESYTLDIDFDTFDDKLTQYRKDLKKYWADREKEYSSSPY